MEGVSKGVKMGDNTRWIIYLSLLVVVALGVLAHFTTSQLISSGSLLVIAVVVIGNIGYAYSRSKKAQTGEESNKRV
jgi:uncharacterized membrane protein YoaK (UPF0700 family)